MHSVRKWINSLPITVKHSLSSFATQVRCLSFLSLYIVKVFLRFLSTIVNTVIGCYCMRVFTFVLIFSLSVSIFQFQFTGVTFKYYMYLCRNDQLFLIICDGTDICKHHFGLFELLCFSIFWHFIDKTINRSIEKIIGRLTDKENKCYLCMLITIWHTVYHAYRCC